MKGQWMRRWLPPALRSRWPTRFVLRGSVYELLAPIDNCEVALTGDGGLLPGLIKLVLQRGLAPNSPLTLVTRTAI